MLANVCGIREMKDFRKCCYWKALGWSASCHLFFEYFPITACPVGFYSFHNIATNRRWFDWSLVHIGPLLSLQASCELLMCTVGDLLHQVQTFLHLIYTQTVLRRCTDPASHPHKLPNESSNTTCMHKYTRQTYLCEKKKFLYKTP